MSEPLERLEPSYGNGLAVHDVLLDDYLRIGVSQNDALRMIHGQRGDALQHLVERMEEGDKEYYGIRQDSLLAGFAALGDWYYGDEQPFLTTVEYYSARMQHKRNEIFGDDTKPSYDGIHAFGVAGYAGEYDTVATSLLEGLRLRSSERGKIAIRAALDTEDRQLIDIFEREGQKLDRKLGKISLGGITRSYSLYEIETA